MPVHVQVNGRKYLIKGDAPTNSDMYLQVGQYSATAVTDFLWTVGDKDEEVANDRKYSCISPVLPICSLSVDMSRSDIRAFSNNATRLSRGDLSREGSVHGAPS
jgi:hypothetical protein